MISSLWDEISANCIKLHRQHLSRRRIKLEVQTSHSVTFYCPLQNSASIPAVSPNKVSRRWWEEKRLWAAGSARSVSQSVSQSRFSHQYHTGELFKTASSLIEFVPKYIKLSRWEEKSTLLNAELRLSFLGLVRSLSRCSAPLTARNYQAAVSSQNNTVPEPKHAAVKTATAGYAFPVQLSK